MKMNVFIIAVSLYIILFLVTWNPASLIPLSFILFMLFPFILVGMIYFVLKEKGFSYPELGEKDEWGYLDKKKSEMGLMG
jgi:Mn2+/Fe2+ NRAMP family transporter